MTKDFKPLSTYLALSSICEVQRGEGADQAAGMRDESVPRSQRYVYVIESSFREVRNDS